MVDPNDPDAVIMVVENKLKELRVYRDTAAALMHLNYTHFREFHEGNFEAYTRAERVMREAIESLLKIRISTNDTKQGTP